MYLVLSYISHLCLDRVERLKDARSEAQNEIDQIKSSKEQEFGQFVQKVCLEEMSLNLPIM